MVGNKQEVVNYFQAVGKFNKIEATMSPKKTVQKLDWKHLTKMDLRLSLLKFKIT